MSGYRIEICSRRRAIGAPHIAIFNATSGIWQGNSESEAKKLVAELEKLEGAERTARENQLYAETRRRLGYK